MTCYKLNLKISSANCNRICYVLLVLFIPCPDDAWRSFDCPKHKHWRYRSPRLCEINKISTRWPDAVCGCQFQLTKRIKTTHRLPLMSGQTCSYGIRYNHATPGWIREACPVSCRFHGHIIFCRFSHFQINYLLVQTQLHLQCKIPTQFFSNLREI